MPSRATPPASTLPPQAGSTCTPDGPGGPSPADLVVDDLAAAVARVQALEAAARAARREALGQAVDDEAAALARRRYEAQLVIDQGVADEATLAAAKAELEQLPKSWALPSADGAYNHTIAVRTRSWLRAVGEWLASDEGKALLRKAKQGIGSALKVAEHEAEHANQDTGRGVTTSHATIARDTGIHLENVRKIRKVLRLAGWEQEIVRGRYLRKAERQIAADVHGGSQWRAASVRALTVPSRDVAAALAADEARHAEEVRVERRRAQQRRRTCRRRTPAAQDADHSGGHVERVSTPLPPSGKSSCLFSSSVVTNARTARGTRSTIDQGSKPHSRAAHRLAARLIADIAIAKLRSSRTAPLVRAVAPLADAGWSAHDVKTAIDQWHRDHDRIAIPVAAQRNPLGLLIHQIRTICTPSALSRCTPTPAKPFPSADQSRGTNTAVPQSAPKPANFVELVNAARQAPHTQEVDQ